MRTERRSYEQEWRNQPGPSGLDAPVNDSLSSLGRKSIPYDTGGRTSRPVTQCFGRVIEFIPYLNCYRVVLENDTVVPCTALTLQSTLPWGPAATGVYGPGQDVLVTLRASLSYGIIMGAVPQPVANPNDWRPDAIFSGSNVGYFLDGTSNYWTGRDENDLTDFSDGRPIDSTGSPETSVQGKTGVGMFQDDFMIAAKVDEETGIFGFYDDSLMRLAGRNLQIRSSGLEEEHLSDEGEFTGYRGRTPYPWEAMGAYQPYVTTSRNVLDLEPPPEEGEEGEEPPPEEEGNPAESPQISGVRYGFNQPVSYDQQPFHRITEYEGYLGQGGRKSVLAPGGDIEGKEDTAVNTYSEDVKWLTLLAEQASLAGRKVETSIGGHLFIKRPPPPTPKRKERPESPLGDLGKSIGTKVKNYDPCGMQINLDETDELTITASHLVTAEIPLAAEEELVPPEDGSVDPASLTVMPSPDEVIRAALISDEIAYAVAWEGVHPFHYHEKDFYLPQESDLDEFNRSPLPPYESLSKFQFLGQDPTTNYPETISVKVDHRYDEVKIYLNTAFFGLRNDGSFTLRTGCGCEIKSENGTLELAAPGDIRLRPGRNLVTMAGHDVILKARESVDISASENDVRIVAAKNLMAASAVDGDGVMLLQSFSPCILDPKVENVEPEEITDSPTLDPDAPTPDPDAPPPEEPKKKGPTFFMGEEVIGSGVVIKATKAQITACSQEATIEVGRKKYDDEGTDTEFDKAPIDQDTGEVAEKRWEWQPGKIRLYAEFGQIECMGTYVVDYLNDQGTFTADGFDDGGQNSSGAVLQVFLSRKNMDVDDPNVPLEPNDLPPNILAAAGVADLSGNNSCAEQESRVCYQVMSVNEFRAERATICSQLMVNQELFVGGCAYVRGNVVIFGHLDTNFEPNSFDGGLETQRPEVKAVFDEADTRCLQLLPSLMAEQVGKFTATISGSWLDFSCRTMEQYGTTDNFCLMETWWQHQVRIEAERKANENPGLGNPPPAEGDPEYSFNFFPDLPKGIVYWTELHSISGYANNSRTAPYPGIDYVHYEEEVQDDAPTVDPEAPRLAKRCYGVYNLTLVDEENGRPKDRSELLPEEDDGLDNNPLNVYEGAKLTRGAVREFNHYLAIDILEPEEEGEDDNTDEGGDEDGE